MPGGFIYQRPPAVTGANIFGEPEPLSLGAAVHTHTPSSRATAHTSAGSAPSKSTVLGLSSAAPKQAQRSPSQGLAPAPAKKPQTQTQSQSKPAPKPAPKTSSISTSIAAPRKLKGFEDDYDDGGGVLTTTMNIMKTKAIIMVCVCVGLCVSYVLSILFILCGVSQKASSTMITLHPPPREQSPPRHRRPQPRTHGVNRHTLAKHLQNKQHRQKQQAKLRQGTQRVRKAVEQRKHQLHTHRLSVSQHQPRPFLRRQCLF